MNPLAVFEKNYICTPFNKLMLKYACSPWKKVQKLVSLVKFIFSEKATNFCKTPTVDLSYVVKVKSMVDILQNFVAFSEYMNFKTNLSYGHTFC